MARRKDLTALAALGTLGYMLSKRGDKKDEKQTSDAAERRIAADKVASAIPENLDVNRNLDDELYSDTGSKKGRGAAGTSETMMGKQSGEPGTSTIVSPTKKPVAKPVVKSRPMSEAAEAAMQEANVSPTTRAEYDRGISNVPRRKSSDTGNSYYKKGGPVKKMASGGMTSSASKRADGIATKGKTRGRMC
jgi:hypothetical protein